MTISFTVRRTSMTMFSKRTGWKKEREREEVRIAIIFSPHLSLPSSSSPSLQQTLQLPVTLTRLVMMLPSSSCTLQSSRSGNPSISRVVLRNKVSDERVHTLSESCWTRERGAGGKGRSCNRERQFLQRNTI